MVIDTNEIARSLSTYAPLRPVIKRIGPPPSRRARPSAGRFPRVVEAIVYQQLAGRAASVIHGRLVEATGKKVTPESILALSDDQCATIGLSRSKRDAMRDLSRKTSDGLIHFERHGKLSDKEVVAELVQVYGIGPWTAHMYLMHDLGRHDVWPVLDYGVRNGWTLIHDLDSIISSRELEEAADHLAPWRSSVAWYCWRVADGY